MGAGITGTSLAYHLARQNVRVTLIDEVAKPGNNVTKDSFAWITAGHDTPGTYLNLRQQAMADWHRVEDELNGQLKIDWSGSLTWRNSAVETERIAHKFSGFGNQVRLVNQQEIHLLEPNLKMVPEQAVFAENEGAINPVVTTALFIQAAREAGAGIQPGNGLLSFIKNGSRIKGVVTTHGDITADMVVLATGANTVMLCEPLGLMLPINTSPAILMHFHNDHRFVNRIVSNPFMEVRAASNTLTLAAENYMDDSIENNPQAIAQRTLEEIKTHWQGTGQIKLVNVMVGKRAIPQDGLPVIGRVTAIEGLYLFVMHSGVTLAAIAGRLAAAEIASGQDDSLLSAYRPERFIDL